MITAPIERYAWRSLVIVPVIAFVVAVKGLISGAPSNPALVVALTGLDWAELRAQQPGIAQLIGVLKRHESVALLGWGFWLLWTNIQGDRVRSRWVWYGWWTVPLLTTAFVVTGAGVGGGLRGVLLAVTVLTVLSLLLSRRSFLAAGTPATQGQASGSTFRTS